MRKFDDSRSIDARNATGGVALAPGRLSALCVAAGEIGRSERTIQLSRGGREPPLKIAALRHVPSDLPRNEGSSRTGHTSSAFKVSAAPLRRYRGGQLIAQIAPLPGNPYDGHTLAAVVLAITRQMAPTTSRSV